MCFLFSHCQSLAAVTDHHRPEQACQDRFQARIATEVEAKDFLLGASNCRL